MSQILFPTDTTGVTPATGDIILIADVSDSNNPKDCTLAELPISTATQSALDLKANLVSPTLVTPVLGVATATSINGATITSGTLNGTATGTNTGDQTITNTSDATSHTATLSATGGSIKLVEGSNITLTTTGTGADGIVTIASTALGSGDVVGPASATDNAIARFDSTTGKLLQNSAVTIADTTGDITGGKYNTVAISGSTTPTLAVTGTTAVSGTNTGDQTITLTGAVTGSGTGSFATTIATPGTVTVSSTNSTATAHTHAVTSSSAPGAAASILATDASGHVGSTGTRIVKLWATDITATNAIAGSITGNAATVTTNANLTGHITSTGNAAVLGSFTTAQLNTALSDNDIATGGGTATGTNTGNQTIANTSDATSHTATLSATGGSIKLVEGTGITLTTTGTSADGIITIATSGVGSGDVVGPASATDNAIARFDTTTGKLLQNSGVTIGDTNIVSGVATLNAGAVNATAQSEFSMDFSDTILSGGGLTFYGATHRRINDGGSNELIKFPTTSVAGAVNEFTISNAATGTGPTISATGGDTNIDFNIVTKGSGILKVNGSAVGGSGTVTATAGSLTSNAVVLGAGTTDTKVSTGITTDGTAQLNLGVNATTIGKVKMFGNTSGDVTIQPTAAAGTATVQTLPATTGTLVNRVTTANGVSASNTDGALSVTLGAITPTTVNGHTFTAGSSTFTGTAAAVYTFPTSTKTIAANDGSNMTLASQATGDIITASSATALNRIADVAVGSVLVSGGVGVAPSYSANPQVTTIELGHASDTSIARVSAGVVSIEGVNIVKAGAVTTNGITMSTNKLLGRGTASTGAIEEITLGTNLSLSGTTLNAAGGGSIRRIFSIAGKIGATGTNVANTFVADGTFTISKVSLWYGIAGSGTLTVDVNKNGTTLFATTKPSITTTNQSSINSGTLTTTSLASGDVLTIDIDAVPGTPGTDLYVEIVYS